MDELIDLANRFAELAYELDQEALKIINAKVEEGAKSDIEQAVRGDIGDLSMSGWPRKRPMLITGHAEIKNESIEVRPATDGAGWRRGLGPMRVLESGRSAYTKGDSRFSGNYVSKKTGLVRAKSRKVKRNVAATEGRRTWSDALVLLKKNTPDRAMTALMDKTVKQLFGR